MLEEVLLRARNRRGRDIDCRVSITPLNGADGASGGAILLMEQHATTDGAHAATDGDGG